MTNRRQFLRAATALALAARSVGAAATEKAAARKLSLLITDADGFFGTQIVAAATRRGHAIQPFSRPHGSRIEKLRGKAAIDAPESAGKTWDAIIDTSSAQPKEVAALTTALAGRIERYVLISSTGVYATLDKVGLDETAPLAGLADAETPFNDASASGYRALCEKEAATAMPGRVCVIRAGLTTGPADPHDRLAYWAARVARGGDVLAPGSAGDFVQLIDVRDLADFVVTCVERNLLGVFNADSPAGAITMGSLLAACKKITKSEARFVWADFKFMREQGIAPYTDMPLWAPASGAYVGFGRISTAKATAAGLHCRPLADSIADTLAWLNAQPTERRERLHAGLTVKRESAALKAWHTAHAAG